MAHFYCSCRCGSGLNPTYLSDVLLRWGGGVTMIQGSTTDDDEACSQQKDVAG